MFANRWNGPCRIKKQLSKGSYVLEEVNGTELKRNYAASHIKRFFPRGRKLEDIQQEKLDPEDGSQSRPMEEDQATEEEDQATEEDEDDENGKDTMDQSYFDNLLDMRLNCSRSTLSKHFKHLYY